MKYGRPRKATTEAVAAFSVWARVFDKQYGTTAERMKEFAEFLGDPMGPHRSSADEWLIINTNNPDVMSAIEKINGPHGYTFLKMLKAQNEHT